MKLLTRGWRNEVSFFFKIGWVVKTLGYWTGEWFFVQVKYVVASWANCLGGADMQVRSHFGLWAERKPGCPSSFWRLSGRIQAHVRSPRTISLSRARAQASGNSSCAVGRSNGCRSSTAGDWGSSNGRRRAINRSQVRNQRPTVNLLWDTVNQHPLKDGW